MGQTLKGLEDLDILVEVLQEDLNKSQLKKEALHAVPDGFRQGFSTDPQAAWWETGGSKQAAGSPQEKRHSSAMSRSYCSFKDFNSVLWGEVETSHQDQKNTQGHNSPGIFSRTSEKGSSWWIQGACTSTQKDFPKHSSQNTSPLFNASAGCSETLLEANTGSPDPEGHLKLNPVSFTQQDLSAVTFFQFQLHKEESLLRNIPADKLLAPDENGNRSPILLLKYIDFLRHHLP